MSKKEKLIERFKSLPKDFTYDEIVALLKHFGFTEISNDGSRRAFADDGNRVIYLHEPHPGNIMKGYMMKHIKDCLEEWGII